MRAFVWREEGGMDRIIEMDLPDEDDCPTCGSCGEDFGSARYYDNETFQYICEACAVSVESTLDHSRECECPQCVALSDALSPLN